MKIAGQSRRSGGRGGGRRARRRLGARLARASCRRAIAREIEERRLFLWIPVAAMAGVSLNIAADREPVLWLPALLALATSARSPSPRAAGGWRSRCWSAPARFAQAFCRWACAPRASPRPVLDHIRIVKLQGFVEEIDFRAVGARLILRVDDAGDMPAGVAPRRVRVTTRKAPDVAAGDYVALTARLLPPSHASLPGGYDFSRDAYFAGIGAVGSTLGAVTPAAAARRCAARLALCRGDRPRAQCARRPRRRDHWRRRGRHRRGDGDRQARFPLQRRQGPHSRSRHFPHHHHFGRADDAGRRHFLLDDAPPARFVADARAALSRSRNGRRRSRLSGAIAYDVCTGSRVGTERALIMTLIVLGAVIVDRRALTMRNLGLRDPGRRRVGARGDSRRQLSALLRRGRRAGRGARGAAWRALKRPAILSCRAPRAPRRGVAALHLIDKPLGLVVATLCATSATASFMAYHFHDLSPYVLIGNPLTLDGDRILRRARRADRRRRFIRSGSTRRSGSMSAPASSSFSGSRALSPRRPARRCMCAPLRPMRCPF